MKYTHIFWDWNGTLLNDSWLSTKVISEMFERRNLKTISLDDYRNLFRFPIIDFYKEVSFNFEEEDYQEVGKEFISNYNAQRNECSLHDGAYEIVKDIYAKGISQSVVSAYEVNFLRDVVKQKKLDFYMHSIVGLDNIYASSKVEMAKNHFLELGLSPQEVLFIGDTEHDSHSAQEIGCDCVFMSNGHCSKSRLQELNKHKVFSHFDELRDFLNLY